MHLIFAELLEIVLKDVKDFDPRIWIYAVSISMSALIILGCTVCLLLLRDHYEELEWRLQQGKFGINLIFHLSEPAIDILFNRFLLLQRKMNTILSNWCRT